MKLPLPFGNTCVSVMSRVFSEGFPPDVPPESAEELYENAPCGYLSTTPDGRIVRVNQTFADMIDYERSELIGHRRFADLLTIGGRIFYETHFALMLRMHGEVREIALELQTAGGSVVPILVSAVQKRDAAGNPVLNRITVFNATDRRSYERELLASRKRAEEAGEELARINAELSRSNAALLQANEELGQFAYAASHDLQEPLRTITAYAQLLERRYQDVLDEHGRAFVANIVDGARRMQSLISDLLALSQAQAAHFILRPTDLGQVLTVALSNLRSSIEETGATVTQEKLPVVMADAPRIAQVFQNLVGNAIKYRKPDEPPHVRVIAGKDDTDHWTISYRTMAWVSIAATLSRYSECSTGCTDATFLARESGWRSARR
jgi:PAS domain S-box-containing protein